MKNYIQIGANTGHDEFQSIIEKLEEKSNIVLLEPNTDLIEKLVKAYDKLQLKHNISFCPYGISLTSGEENLYIYGTIDGNYSLVNRKSHPLTPVTTSKKIKTITFKELCDNFNIHNIECLFIDTEGLDYEILNSIDIYEIDIKIIIFEEWIHEDDDQNNKYRTGPKFLHNVLVPKFKDYYWSEFISGGMNNFRLTKKSS